MLANKSKIILHLLSEIFFYNDYYDQMIEDLSMMRTLPNMTVLSTSDDTQTKWAVKKISKKETKYMFV